ncbi:M56 family metallopeptidase [Methylomonas sp. BW4-1]|uniref:M56 family metallopeptidase n=1 Tax=Methylomonas sp. BW4-1 TaxID=3376685 RepID=UPI0040431F17
MNINQTSLNVDSLPSRTANRFNSIGIISILIVYDVSDTIKKSLEIFINTSLDIPDVTWRIYTIIGFLVISAIFYFLLPILIIGKRQLERANQQEHQAIVEGVVRLSKLLNISPPNVYISYNPLQDAQAFGAGNPKNILINNGLISVFRRKPAYFDAVVLHELSHIKNKDVFKAYASRSILYALTIIFISIPLISGIKFIYEIMCINWDTNFFWQNPFFYISENMFRFLQNLNYIIVFMPTLLLITVEWFLLVRDRENYADYKACQTGSYKSLVEIFEKKAEVRNKKSKFLTSITSRFHPSAFDRLKFIKQPLNEMSRLRSIDAFLFGVMMQLMLTFSGNFVGSTAKFFVSTTSKFKITDYSKEELITLLIFSLFFAILSSLVVIDFSKLSLTSSLSSRFKRENYFELIGKLPLPIFFAYLGSYMANKLSVSNIDLDANTIANWFSIHELFSISTILPPACQLINFLWISSFVFIVAPWTNSANRPRVLYISSLWLGYMSFNLSFGFVVVTCGRLGFYDIHKLTHAVGKFSPFFTEYNGYFFMFLFHTLAAIIFCVIFLIPGIRRGRTDEPAWLLARPYDAP